MVLANIAPKYPTFFSFVRSFVRYIFILVESQPFIHVLHSLPFHLQDDHKAFRRQLEDKRPIVESNLTSGRQYIANEAAVSDTSDTEGKFYFYDHQRPRHHTLKSRPTKLPIKWTTKRFATKCPSSVRLPKLKLDLLESGWWV